MASFFNDFTQKVKINIKIHAAVPHLGYIGLIRENIKIKNKKLYKPNYVNKQCKLNCPSKASERTAQGIKRNFTNHQYTLIFIIIKQVIGV